jgi:uncharacterized protein YacL
MVLATAIALVSAIITSIIADQLDLIDSSVSDLSYAKIVFIFITGVFFAPLIETVFVAGAIKVLQYYIKGEVLPILATASLAALLHSFPYSFRALAVYIPFVIFTAAYVTWNKATPSQGFKMAALVHAFYNLVLMVPALLFHE